MRKNLRRLPSSRAKRTASRAVETTTPPPSTARRGRWFGNTLATRRTATLATASPSPPATNPLRAASAATLVDPAAGHPTTAHIPRSSYIMAARQMHQCSREKVLYWYLSTAEGDAAAAYRGCREGCSRLRPGSLRRPHAGCGMHDRGSRTWLLLRRGSAGFSGSQPNRGEATGLEACRTAGWCGWRVEKFGLRKIRLY